MSQYVLESRMFRHFRHLISTKLTENVMAKQNLSQKKVAGFGQLRKK
jgi:hypothetical protein